MSDEIKGRLHLRGDEGYEEARVGRIFNARKPDRYPAAILEVADVRRRRGRRPARGGATAGR